MLVRDEELLQRGVRAEWIDADGVPTIQAFRVNELKDPARGGISVHRKFPSDEAKTAPALMRWPAHVDAEASAVRAIRSHEGGQAFEVHADPTPDDPGHALVRFADPANPPKRPRFERDKLLDVFRYRTAAAK